MKPIFARDGRSFGYDLVIGQTLVSISDHRITRVFVLSLPDQNSQAAFFADPGYPAVVAEHFAPAVDGFATLAQVDRRQHYAARGTARRGRTAASSEPARGWAVQSRSVIWTV